MIYWLLCKPGWLFRSIPLSLGQPLVLGLNPIVEMMGEMFFLSKVEMAAVHVRNLRHPIGSPRHRRDAIVAAVDLLLTGI